MRKIICKHTVTDAVEIRKGQHAQHAEQHSYSSQQNPAKQYIRHPSNNLLNHANKHCLCLRYKVMES